MSFKLKFVQDDTVNETEVIIKAKAQTEEVNKILELLGGEKLSCQLLSDQQLIDMNDIIILSKSGRFISVKTINGEYVVSEPLYQIEPKLNPTWFVKISQSEIVNLKYVKKWSLEGGGIIKIEMINNIKSYTSRRYTKTIRVILKGGKTLK
ncbi:MAG: LytTR family DNA-binding domain-containing protein [Bacilli bacterium]|nr:LytTR family DNA-binding domain-containing protein [Bacilli bacterium]HHX70116.1 LytTR family transcriptional regulator [Gallicola sp.]